MTQTCRLPAALYSRPCTPLPNFPPHRLPPSPLVSKNMRVDRTRLYRLIAEGSDRSPRLTSRYRRCSCVFSKLCQWRPDTATCSRSHSENSEQRKTHCDCMVVSSLPLLANDFDLHSHPTPFSVNLHIQPPSFVRLTNHATVQEKKKKSERERKRTH